MFTITCGETVVYAHKLSSAKDVAASTSFRMNHPVQITLDDGEGTTEWTYEGGNEAEVTNKPHWADIGGGWTVQISDNGKMTFCDETGDCTYLSKESTDLLHKLLTEAGA